MVVSPKGQAFFVDVKGQYKPNFWPVSQKETAAKLFYVLAFVPENEPNQFFILTQEDVNGGIRKDWQGAVARRKAKGLPGDPGDFHGITWSFAARSCDP